MATFRKRGNSWRADVERGGTRKSASFPTKAAAAAWAATVEAEIAAGKSGRFPEKSFRDLLTRYGDEISTAKRGGRWERVRIALILRESGLAERQVASLTSADFAAWRDRRLRQVSGSSVARELSLLSHAFSIAVREWRWCAENPISEIRHPQANPPRDRRVSADEIDRIMVAAGWDRTSEPVSPAARAAAAFLVAIETGMRAGEICGLTWDRLDLAQNVAHLPMTKNGSRRDVALSSEASRIISLFARGDGPVFGMTPSRLDAVFRKIRDRAAIADLHFHDSRHEAVTRLAAKIDVLDLARMIGHRDLRMLMRYYNKTAADIAKSLD